MVQHTSRWQAEVSVKYRKKRGGDKPPEEHHHGALGKMSGQQTLHNFNYLWKTNPFAKHMESLEEFGAILH